MELHVVFAQRRCQYPGEYGPEALACATEYEVDDNPDHLVGVEANAREDEGLERVARVVLEVEEEAVKRILFPEATAIQTSVLEPKGAE